MLNCSWHYIEGFPMAHPERDGVVSGLVLGLAVAFTFALVIRYVPASWLLDPLPRALLYAVQVPAGLLFVPIATGVARARAESPRQVLLWACCGALAFDGLVLGFWPSLYGHAGAAHAMVATLLLWAFAWIVAAALLATTDRASAAS
jgi:hypothetical protein